MDCAQEPCCHCPDSQRNTSCLQVVRLLKGSPQVVLNRAWNKAELNDVVNNKMIEFAQRGFRSLGLAMAEVGFFNT